MAEIKSYPNNVNEEIGAEHVMRWHHGRTTGVYGAAGELAVAALSTPAMGVTVSDGSGWLTDAAGNGIHFWNDVFATSAALLQLPVETADGVLNRIDRVIVEWSTPNYTQLPEVKVLKGTSAVSPSAPALTNSASMRQISLARINVAAGTLAITSGMITDERFDASVCGIVTETTEVDTSMATAQFTEVLNEAQQLVNDLQGEAVIDHAGTHEPGGDDPTKFVFYGGIQTLTDPEKAQARTNMGAIGKSTLHAVTLAAASWSSGLYVVSLSDITATCPVEILPAQNITAAQLNALQAANIQENAQAAGSITLKAFGTVPAVNIPIRVIVRGDL